MPFHSLPAVPDLGHQFLSLNHVHGITILTQNSTIGSHGQLHPFWSIKSIQSQSSYYSLRIIEPIPMADTLASPPGQQANRRPAGLGEAVGLPLAPVISSSRVVTLQKPCIKGQ